MILKPLTLLTAFLFTLGTLSTSFAFPNLQAANGAFLRRQEAEDSTASQAGGLPGQGVDAPPPPGPPSFTGTKLVNDRDHPWRPLRNGDIRGPCPGLNTLASHGVSSIHLNDRTFPRVTDNSRSVSSPRRRRQSFSDHKGRSRRYVPQ